MDKEVAVVLARVCLLFWLVNSAYLLASMDNTDGFIVLRIFNFAAPLILVLLTFFGMFDEEIKVRPNATK